MRAQVKELEEQLSKKQAQVDQMRQARVETMQRETAEAKAGRQKAVSVQRRHRGCGNSGARAGWRACW